MNPNRIARMGTKGNFRSLRYGIANMSKISSASVDWWLSGGIDSANVAGVWQPKGAASLDASYLRLAGDEGYADIDPAVVGGVAPTWDAVNGWISNGTTQYLKTGIIPPLRGVWGGIIRFSNATINGYKTIFGARKLGNIDMFVDISNRGTSVVTRNGVDGHTAVSPALANGTYFLNGTDAYRNGVFEASAVPDPYANVNDIQLYIMCMHDRDIWHSFYAGNIQAIAFYKATLTAPQVLAVSNAMALL